MAEDDTLARAVGRVALADAEVDEWLQQTLIVLLRPLTPETVRILTSRDSAHGKVDKIRRLLTQADLLEVVPDGQDDAVSGRLRRIKSDKEERDLAVHSVYDTRAAGALRRFRSRSPQAVTVTADSIDLITERLESHSRFLRALVEAMEGVSEVGLGDLEANVLDDARELLLATQLRLTDDQVTSLRSTTTLRLGMRGLGRWRTLAPDEQVATDEIEARIDTDTGKIECVRPDGTTFSGGDTGWRDVTEVAQEHDDTVNEAFLRRIHNQVLIRQDGGADLHVAIDELERSGLLGRLFGPHRDDVQISLDWVPEGFRPGVEDR